MADKIKTLTAAEKARVEELIRTGQRVQRKAQPGIIGIVLERTPAAVLVWWGTSDNRPITSWHQPDDLEPADTRAWPELRGEGSPSGHPRPARKVRVRQPRKPKKAAEVGIQIDLRDGETVEIGVGGEGKKPVRAARARKPPAPPPALTPPSSPKPRRKR